MVWYDVAINARGAKGGKCSILPLLDDVRDQGMFIPVTLDLWVQQAIQVHDPPRPALHRFVRVALLLPPHAPHTVNLQHFQLPHNVSVRLGVEVHEAAVGATKDELEARLGLGANGAVKLAPQ